MFPSVYRGKPEWMAMTPHIPAARHVLPPSILGNNSPPHSKATPAARLHLKHRQGWMAARQNLHQ